MNIYRFHDSMHCLINIIPPSFWLMAEIVEALGKDEYDALPPEEQ
jgi:hypothetical protein